MSDLQINPNNTLFFIPDISGFTEFVNTTEISHAKHIIEELLEAIIDANIIGLELSEIEGDAIFFYRKGKAPTAEELLNQIRSMYTSFHAHLKRYDTHRICNCGACLTANNLQIKFIAHFGEALDKQVKDHSKLFGKDVIVAHRLLKNQVSSNEYGLFSEKLISADPTWANLEDIAWAKSQHAEDKYDSGTTRYSFIELSPLLKEIPEPVAEDFTIEGATHKLFSTGAVIDAPIDVVFNILADLNFRKEIQAGLSDVDQVNHEIMQIGSEHRCIVKDTSTKPKFVTHDFTFEQNKINFVESDQENKVSVIWSLNANDSTSTNIEISNFIKPNFIKKLMFKLLLQKKYSRLLNQSFTILNSYCRHLLEENQNHPNKIILPEGVLQNSSDNQ